MSTACIDTSVLAAISFDEPDAGRHARWLDEFDRLISSSLLETELRAALARGNLVFRESAIAGIEWVLPDRPLASELATVLETGQLGGADLWHVATALYVFPQPSALSLAALDARQGAVAQALGFAAPWN